MLKVRDIVEIINDESLVVATGVVVNVNDFREPSMKYAVEVVGYDDCVFIGDNNIRKI